MRTVEEYRNIRSMVDAIHTTAKLMGYDCVKFEDQTHYFLWFNQSPESKDEDKDGWKVRDRITVKKNSDKVTTFIGKYYTNYSLSPTDYIVYRLEKILQNL